jgi:hypothetical protein
MRQLNETGYDKHVSVWSTDEHPEDHPFVVAAGEETDFHSPIGGLTPIPEPEPEKPKRKDAAVAAEKEEGEPQ